MSKRVDVFVPCYQYGHFLRDCVGSVLTQEGVEVRVLIIDDASSDNIPEVARDLAERDSRIEYRRHCVNQGHINTYNEGLDWVSGDYMLLLSADDLLAPGALLRATSIMDSHPRVGLTYGMAVKDIGTPYQLPLASSEWQIIAGNQFLEHICNTGINPIPTPTAVVRTELQKTLGGYRPELPHTGDMEMWMRFAVHSDIGVLKACQGIYRWHGNNMQHHYIHSALGDLIEHKYAFDRVFFTYQEQLQDAQRLHCSVLKLLAENAFRKADYAFDHGDLDSYKKCLNFAVTTYPEIASSSSWARLKCKAFIGPKVWSRLRPWWDWVTRITPGKEEKPARKETVIFGWWPQPVSEIEKE